ncbi:MAG: hypothetical protein FWD61_15850 [Phycisphaerales bacterium]|nr:hypothetical protein [Phycisphaerales bacterium]
MMRPLARSLAVLVILGVSSLIWAQKEEKGGGGESYPIQLGRSGEVGDVYDTHITLEQTGTVTTTSAQSEPRERSLAMKADLQGRVKMLEKNADSSLLELTVKKFVDETGENLIDANKVIDIKRSATQSSFSAKDGGELSEKVKNLLNQLYPPEQGKGEAKSGASDDDVFGSKTPRKVGESWPINSEAAAKMLARSDVTVDPKDVTGKMTLKGVETINGGNGKRGKALRIVGTIDVANFKSSCVPSGVNVDSVGKMQLSGLYPVDASPSPAELETIVDATIVMNLGGAKSEVKTHQVRKETKMPVKE